MLNPWWTHHLYPFHVTSFSWKNDWCDWNPTPMSLTSQHPWWSKWRCRSIPCKSPKSQDSHPVAGEPHSGLTWCDLRLSQHEMEVMNIPSGKRLHSYRKSQFLMGKSTISMATFNSYFDITRGYINKNRPNRIPPAHGLILPPSAPSHFHVAVFSLANQRGKMQRPPSLRSWLLDTCIGPKWNGYPLVI